MCMFSCFKLTEKAQQRGFYERYGHENHDKPRETVERRRSCNWYAGQHADKDYALEVKLKRLVEV